MGPPRATGDGGGSGGAKPPGLEMERSTGGQAYYVISVVAQKYDIHPQTLRLTSARAC